MIQRLEKPKNHKTQAWFSESHCFSFFFFLNMFIHDYCMVIGSQSTRVQENPSGKCEINKFKRGILSTSYIS